MNYVIIIIFILVFFFGGLELGYSKYSPLYTHFTYVFQHSSWIHLIINCIAFISFYKTLNKALPAFLFLTYAYFIAVISSFFSEYTLPTVGASGLVYGMVGLYISIGVIGTKLIVIDKRQFLFGILFILFFLLISSYKTNVNAKCHTFSLIGGIIAGILDNRFNTR